MRDRQSLAREADALASANLKRLEGDVIGVVRGRLMARKMRLDVSDLEEAYNIAWHGVCEQIKRGTKVRNLTGMLVEITFRRATDAYRAAAPAQHVDVPVEERGADFDIDQQIDDQVKLRRFIARLKGRLNEQERSAVSLTLIHGYTRPEAARRLGISPRRMEKIMDGATLKIGAVVASITSRGCGDSEWTRMMRDYALGLLAEDHRDYARAQAHIESCDACRRYVLGLRGIAAITPPLLPFMPLGGHEGLVAHLEALFGGGHGGAAAGAAAQGSVGAGAAGGSGLLGPAGAGIVAKGAAGVAVAGLLAAGIHAVAVGHRSHGVARHSLAREAPLASDAHTAPLGSLFAANDLSRFPAGLGTFSPHQPAKRPQSRRAFRSHSHSAGGANREFSFERSASSRPHHTAVAATVSLSATSSNHASFPSSTEAQPRRTSSRTSSPPTQNEYAFER
ncbi:MAG TPA: sigma-70 family RNA polymerase sigma factor [Solirubrobacteraceae bacterium]|jgi:DNA-directed RNA polymerase specialized sigma24 family protein|nr:sigma-70 family RNA polymerase sigma factor [Solirubrobacteraceae bacterium]